MKSFHHKGIILESFESRSNHDLEGFKMIYQSTQSDDYMWHLILRGKEKIEKKPNTKFLPIFNGRNNKCIIFFHC